MQVNGSCIPPEQQARVLPAVGVTGKLALRVSGLTLLPLLCTSGELMLLLLLTPLTAIRREELAPCLGKTVELALVI